MAPANNKTALKAEIERKLEKENLERRLRLERERKPTEVPGVKIPQFLTRNALAKGLTNLGVPDLLPLRDAMLSLSDPGFLNKKFNQDVYRELPQRVKDFIALPANQVTRAVIISKIIEAVKLSKKNANNANFNRGVAKALVNLAPKSNKNAGTTTNRAWMINKKTPVNAATGTPQVPPPPPATPVVTTATPSGPPPPPPTPPPPMQPIKAQAKNAAEAAAEAAINRQIRLIENNLKKLNNRANLKAEFETLKTNRNINKLTNFSNKVKSFQQGPEEAASGKPRPPNTPAVATMETQTNFNNAQAKLIANLQAQLEQAQQDVAQGKVNANAKVAQITNELEQVKTNLVREQNEAKKAVASLQKELQNASNAEKTNLTRKLENAEAALNLKTKVIALTRARAAVSKNKLRSELSKLQKNKDKLSKELQNKINQLAARNSSNEEIKQVTAERNAALNGLEKYSKTLANVMKNKKLNANTISDLQRRLTELQGISNVTRNELKAQIKQLEQNRNAAVAAKQEANALVKQLQTGQQQLSTNLQGQIANLQGQLAGSTNVTKALTEKVANLTSKKAKALAELQKAKTNLATTRSKLNAKNKNLTNIKSQLVAREGEIKTLTNVSEQLKASLLTQVQTAKALTDKMIREKAEAEERARKFAALMKKFSNELMPKISSATLENINTLNLREYKNIEPEVKAAIYKRKVKLYKIELTKRTTNLANLRTKLAQIPSGTEGKQNLSTQINAEEVRRKRVAPALNFRAKVNGNLEKNIPQTIKNQIQNLKTKLPQNDDLLLKNLATYESNYREIFGRPKKFIFFNKVPAIGNGIFKASNMTIPNIKTFQLGAMGNAFTKQLQQNFATINSSFGDNPINVFFVGPSGSGKTTLFKDYTGSTNLKKLRGITVYKPTLTYDMNQGILYFSDEVIPNYDYSTFARQFIRPTPFNPQSSRAHMSIMNGEKRRVFDLAGKESPVAISELALGFNVFNGNYWKLERTRLSTLVGSKSEDTRKSISNLLTNLGISNTVSISELDEIIVLFIYANFITGKDRGRFGGIINRMKQPIKDYLSKWTFGKGKNQTEFGFEMFKNMLKLDPSAKLSDYFSRINTKSDLIDLKFISEYDSYKANIVKEFELSNKIPKDLQGKTTVVRYIFEMMKRVFEGVYITRSLFSLKFLFDPSKKNISKNLAEFTIAGINENMRFGMKVKKCRPDLPSKVKCLFTSEGNEPLYNQTQKNIKNNKAKNNFVVLPLSTSEFKYKTSFYKDIEDKNFKNCLIGVISDFETLPSKVKQQRQSLEFFKKI
jgi:hypothetical protein